MQILVVEDQDSIRSLIEALVSARGHKVVAVASGAKALDIAFQSAPDIVLLDLHLPGQYDGFAVCEKLRANPATKNTPVLIISAKDDAPARARATEVGATAFYGKPFSPTALLAEIERPRSRRQGLSAPPRHLPPRTYAGSEQIEKALGAVLRGGEQTSRLVGGDAQFLAELRQQRLSSGLCAPSMNVRSTACWTSKRRSSAERSVSGMSASVRLVLA
jgi:DNA-binding response OmpR family regulator